MKLSRNLLFIILIFLGCSKNKKPNRTLILQQGLEKEKKNKHQKKIIITGTTDDLKAFQYFNLINDSYLFGGNHKSIERDIFDDSLRFVLDSINNSQLMDIWTFGDTLYHARVFVMPGDTLSFEIKNRKIKFTGKNAYQNNFFTELYNSTLDYSKNPYKSDLSTYKQSIKSIYDKKTTFFDQYIKKNKITSNDFINLVRADLKFEYLNNLINPRDIKAEKIDFYFNHEDGLMPIIEREFSNNETIFNFVEYFDNVSIEDFKNQGLISSHFYKNSLNAYIRYYFETSEYVDYSKEFFLAEKEFIEKNLDGELELYAIARMIVDYNKKGFGYSTNNIEFLRGLINEYEDKFKKLSYKEKMNEIKEDLNNFNFELSDAALNSKLISIVGDTITLKEIFDRSTKRIKVIDFWATWCPPCIREIKKAKTFKDGLSVKNNVEWIYLSIDKDKKKWLEKSEELKEFLNVRNQYLILGGINSSLARYLKISGIPRYVIFDRQNKIVLNNAPRPSDSVIFQKIIDNLYLKRNILIRE